MNRCSVLLQIPQPSTPRRVNGMYCRSPMPQDRLSPQLYKPNPIQLSQIARTLPAYNMSPKPFVQYQMPCTTAPMAAEGEREEIDELTRGISGLYVIRPARQRRLNVLKAARQRRLNVWSTTTRGGSGGLFGGLLRRPGRFKIRTLHLGGTNKVEHK
ncbi:hypothetical protein CJ030_MR2G002017 [Morella rubra]|uniref:Uncharacterized protein n=1 Tax=Morella rubra TaxID=262757 RepID=A0A6A1WAN2_9ROSI|nr:hypothetical protein CJ030_MR2G002017 [Morella rubra]